MSMLDETIKIIAELEAQEKKLTQAVNRNQEEQKRLLYRIKMANRKEESNRVHKMIVLGSTIWAEFLKSTYNTDEDLIAMLHRPDEDFVKFAKRLFKNSIAYYAEKTKKENSDSV